MFLYAEEERVRLAPIAPAERPQSLQRAVRHIQEVLLTAMKVLMILRVCTSHFMQHVFEACQALYGFTKQFQDSFPMPAGVRLTTSHAEAEVDAVKRLEEGHSAIAEPAEAAEKQQLSPDAAADAPDTSKARLQEHTQVIINGIEQKPALRQVWRIVSVDNESTNERMVGQ